jgi:Spy/CpxP family protein refolding chaperone
MQCSRGWSRNIRLQAATPAVHFSGDTRTTTNKEPSMNLSRRMSLAGILGLAATGALAHGGGRRGARGPMNPAEMEERIERFIKHVAVEVDATPEQTDKLTTIAKGAARDLAPLRAQGVEMRKQGIALLSAATIDRNAVEQLRAKRMQHADARSRRITQALADAAEVLTPEQRQKAAARAARWGGRFT